MKVKLKPDKYRKARGGWARLLKISCSKCRSKILLYQKDGPGPLKRLYLDRIFTPAELSGLQRLPLKKVPKLICKKCKQIIGTPCMYEKENRPAFHLAPTSFTKQITKLH